MAKVLVLYYSFYGHIEAMATAVAEGAREVPGAKVDIKRVPETMPDELFRQSGGKANQVAPVAKPEELANYDAIIFGTGGEGNENKSFGDWALAVARGDRKFLEKLYGSQTVALDRHDLPATSVRYEAIVGIPDSEQFFPVTLLAGDHPGRASMVSGALPAVFTGLRFSGVWMPPKRSSNLFDPLDAI